MSAQHIGTLLTSNESKLTNTLCFAAYLVIERSLEIWPLVLERVISRPIKIDHKT
jgi:hypothetical protein